MSAYMAKAYHKVSTGKFGGPLASGFRIPEKAVVAQSLFHSTHATADEWQKLAQRLMNSSFQSRFSGDDYLHNAVNTVVEWHDALGCSSSQTEVELLLDVDTQRAHSSEELSDWQTRVFDEFRAKDQTISIYFYTRGGLDAVWVAVQDPTNEVVFDYCSVYAGLLDRLDVYFDFLVTGTAELDSDVPVGGTLITVRGR